MLCNGYGGLSRAIAGLTAVLCILHLSEGATTATNWQQLKLAFRKPHVIYRPVPLWWWDGEPLERERIGWQLGQLKSQGVMQVCVIYLTPNAGVPPYFSEDWWRIFTWMVKRASKLGMRVWFYDQIGFGGAGWHQRVRKLHPEFRGLMLNKVESDARGSEVTLVMPEGAEFISAYAYPVIGGILDVQRAINLSDKIQNGRLHWRAPDGEWKVMLFYATDSGLMDTTNRYATRALIRMLYGEYERRLKRYIGSTIVGSFQDELVLWRFPPWSREFIQEFKRRHGYDIRPFIAALYHDISAMTEKVRCEYWDTIIALTEDAFFKPIFAWHEQRNLLISHDQFGRCSIISQLRWYGDYMRTMRWYSAPGYDDWGRPKLGRNMRDAKLASSIAHLYNRPRVWLEAFHSSGWGLTPQDMYMMANENFIYGANVFDKHGLYYTTYGGWWEWAPPSAHFRQPYWQHCKPLADYLARMCWFNAQGAHVCDVAVLYPTLTIQAHTTLDGRTDDTARRCESCLWSVAETLMRNGIDFDFVDEDSIARGRARNGALHIADEAYRVVILPAITTLRRFTLYRLRQFTDAGGMIVAIGRHPNSTAEYGRNDRFLTDTIRSWMAGNAPKHPTVYHYARDVTDAVQWLRKVLPPLVIVEDGDALMSQCRRIGDAMFFLLFNPTAHERDTWVQLRAVGIPYLWDAETGMVTKLSEFAHTNAYTRMRIRMTPYQAVIIAIRNSAQRASTARDSRKVRLRYGAVERMASEGIGSHVTVPASIELDGEWEFQLEPTCDNRFGDFRRPPSPTKLGAECRRMHCRRELIGEDGVRLGWHLNDFDDSTWVQATYSVGPYFWWLGPIDNPRRERGFDGRLPPEIDTQAQSYNLFGKRMRWKLYWFSKQFGIEKDATYWRTLGPKKRVPLEYINLGRAREWSIAYLRTWLKAQEPMKVQVTLGGMAAKRIWVNGIEVGSVPSISRQRIRTDVELRAGNNLLLIKLAYPRDEHLRVYLDVRERKPVERTLQWIWHPQPPSDKVSYCFRRRFKLPVRPKHATINITADNGYELFINGKFIGRELGFDTHFWKSAEQFDVTKQLRSGDNVIAVRATNLGGPGGLLLHVAIRLPSDKVVHIYSDGTWRCAPADSVEVKGKNAWTSLAFDDSQWQTVATLGAPPVEPWGNIFGMTMPAMPQAPALRWFVEPMPAPFDVFPGDEKRIWWYRFKLPPGTKAIAMRVKCTRIEVYVRGKPLFKRELGIGEHVIRVPVGNLANREGAVCAVRLRTLPGEYGGAVFTTPVAFKTERGRISLGAWAERGLRCYSGIGVYSRLVKLPSAVASKNVRAILELGDVRCTAEVFVNGERVGIRAWSPYRFDITPFVHPGMNRITIKVANTLANHYSVGLPSPYVYAGTTISGLLGPVRIRFEGL